MTKLKRLQRLSDELTTENESRKQADPELQELTGRGHILIRCGTCGKHDLMENWIKTTVFGDLPPGEYQCPNCGNAIRKCWGYVESIPARL